MKWFLSVSAVLSLGAGMALGALGHAGPLWAGFLAFCFLLAGANLDRISEFRASASGISARTREVVTQAENAISELQVLACQVASLSLSLIKRQGRIGGYSDDEAEEMLNSTISTLRRLKVTDAGIEEALCSWHKVNEFDYSHFILGGSHAPEGGCADARAAWTRLREGGIDRRATPQAIRDFLVKYDFMDAERENLILDYEHYIAHREHRRPEVWKQRQNWGRLVATSGSTAQ